MNGGTDPTDTGPTLLLAGEAVGLALMRPCDVPVIARWHQDLGFTARMGTPGEAHSTEARQDAFDRNARIRDDSAEFAVLQAGTGRLVGFGGLFDITPALTATLFVGIGDAADRNRGWGTEATRLICEYGFFFRSLHSIKVSVHAFNHAALRSYARLGFRHAGRLRGANLLNHQRHDEILMDLLHSELELRHVGRFRDLQADAPHA
jgi:RimJ/RimL family protein N-acetyltransferase